MNFDHSHYVPCLRWKQGEYQALLRLKNTSKDHLTPLIEISEIGWDFENETFNKTLDKHLAPVAKRIKDKWGKRCFVDLNILNPHDRLANGQHPVEFVFNDLRIKKCSAVPVIGLERDVHYRAAVSQVYSKDNLGICIRLSLEQAAKPKVQNLIDDFLDDIKINHDECDVILDLGSPNYLPVEGFSKLLQIVVHKLPNLNDWRTVTLIGGSFPSSVAEISGLRSLVPRHEWVVYKDLVNYLNSKKLRIPTFGDYTISHPKVVMLDMRFIKPSAKLIYTTDNAFYVIKGPNVRDNGFTQYHNYCMELVKSKIFKGETFSTGDKLIYDCANRTKNPGNLTTWKWVGTNHHMERVIEDISIYSSSSSLP